MWLAFSLAVNTVFQTYDTSYLVDPGLQRQISSMDDILESGLECSIHPSIVPYLETHPRHSMAAILRRHTDCRDIAHCAQRVAQDGDVATVVSDVTAKYLNTYSTLDSDGKPLLYTLDAEAIVFNYFTIYLPRGSFLLDRISHLIRVSQESGLIPHFWTDILAQSRIKKARMRISSPLDYLTLCMSHLQAAFVLLLVGFSLSLVAFVAEILYYRPRKIRRKVELY
ncbi:uncharacterized protein [Periplaneta americana]|uniref:uncharacterized protein n=1 Tax=Periplaneta americana TaxID=6978 RepID=UPI0037E75ACC